MNNEEKLPPFSYNGKPSSNPYAPFIYSLILAFGVMLGFVINSVTTGKQALIGGHTGKIDDILNYIEVKYVDTVDRTQLVNKSIDKILSNLDPHSVYIPAKEVSEANESLEGNFEGIGIEFALVDDTITVVSSISGGPAETVGMKAGDRIIKIDDTIVAGTKIKDTDVKHHLRGPAGTRVKVSVLRSGVHNLIDYEVTRDKIPLYSVDAAYMVKDDIGYIRISSFSATTHQEFREKVQLLQDKGMKKLIIDLRDNPGGYLQAATEIADELIAGDKLLVYTRGKAHERQNYNAGKPGLFERGSLCLLVDQYSASASEILSGAVQDWDRGTIIGRRSFGKGLVQEQFELRDGSALRLTVARYYTPSGRCIQRPYTRGSEEYYNEIYARMQRGEFVHEDSLPNADTAVYKTSKGRRVYGGGGIRPDIFVPMDTSVNNEYYIAASSFVREFVYKYSSHHAEVLEKYKSMDEYKKNFAVSDAIVNQFYQYADSAGLKEDKAKDSKIEDKLKLSLKARLAQQNWRTEGFFYIYNDNDIVVKTAIQTLQKTGE